MHTRLFPTLFIFLLFAVGLVGRVPVNPDATAEARELLDRLHQLSGQGTLTGQHNYPRDIDGFTRRMAAEQGALPAVFGLDFGFSPRGTLDDITHRQQIVNACIYYHRMGAVITLMWHAVRPIEREPVSFRESVQGELSEAEWRDLVTPGTRIHERWKAQVDVIAWHLRQLQRERVPVLWRPYHEMNGGWFWWGKKEGPDGYAKLWRMLYRRLVDFHGLDNLIWVWNANCLGPNRGPYADYFPGHDVVDILATDFYGDAVYQEADYRSLLELAEGKPIAIGECGPLPTPAVLDAQPRWAWYMAWSQWPWSHNDQAARDAIFGHARTLTLDDWKRWKAANGATE